MKFSSLMDHTATAAIHNTMLMLVLQEGANECQKMHQGLHHDVERLNIRKASKDGGDHLDVITNTKTHLQS
jgi:hypothetical protein